MLIKSKPFISPEFQQGNGRLNSDPFLLPSHPGDKRKLYINVSNTKYKIGYGGSHFSIVILYLQH